MQQKYLRWKLERKFKFGNQTVSSDIRGTIGVKRAHGLR